MKSLIARGCKQVDYCRDSINTNHNPLEPSTAEISYPGILTAAILKKGMKQISPIARNSNIFLS